uniref:ADP-ribosylation factor-like 6 interacting protein 6 n=1 Tax=Oryzias latipes TaxID=8090 RepID=A0A3P9I7J9_ORYLA
MEGPPAVQRAGSGPRTWIKAALSVVGSAVAVAAVGCLCALFYPLFRAIRASSGFWSILVLSLFGGCVCWLGSWTLTYLHRHQPRMAFPTELTSFLLSSRDVSGHAVCMDYGMAFLNGVMGMLTVVWYLS